MLVRLQVSAFLLLMLFGCSPKMAPKATADSESQVPPPPPSPVVPPPPAPLPVTSIPMDPKVRIGTLPNGMTYYIRQNQKPENRAELRLALKAGSMQEDDDQQGLAHFIEHMAFNGTTHFSKNELVDYLERVGSQFGPDLNAYTSFDETVYMLQVRTDEPEQFDKGMLILKDWAFGIAFDSSEIEKERGVVVSEWRSGLSPGERMQKKYFPFLYYNSRYAKRLPIGDPDIVNHAPANVILRFYADWYRPELMALFVVGTVDPDVVEKQIQSQFGEYRSKTIPRKKVSAAVPNHEQTFVKVVTDAEATSANVQIINKHHFTKVTSLLDYRARLVQTLYNRMLGRRLSDLTKEVHPPFLFGFTGYNQDVGDLATYSSYASAESKDIKRAYQALLDENQRVLQHGFTASELEREKANVLRLAEQNALEEDKVVSSRMVQRLITHFLDEAPIPNAAQTLEMYKSMLPTIAVGEVSELARTWITDHSRVIIVTGPAKDKEILPDSVELITLLRATATKNMAPYMDVDLSAPLLPGAFPAQPVLNSSFDPALNIYSWEFANGIRVKAKPTDFKNDEILMVAYSPGGHSLYPDAMYPSARGTSTVIGSSGMGTYNAAALEKKLTGQRVNLSPFIFERYEGLNGSSSVKDLETLLQLSYGYVVKFREDTVALGSYLTRERGTFANLMLNPQNWFSDKVNKISTRYHPRRGFPTLESYDQVKMKEIADIYRDRFRDVSDFDFFFIGNFNTDTLKRMTSRYLAAMPGNGRSETWKDVGERFPAGRIDSVFYRGEAPKSLVQLIYHGTDHFHPDSSYLLQSLIDIARIELREKLREDEGGVYGVSIGGSQSKYPIEQYSIRISFNADPPRTTELANACLEVIRKLKEEIDTVDIIKITEAQRQGRIKDLQQNQFWMNIFISSWLNGTDMAQASSLPELERRIATLSPDVLERAARKYFNENELINLVMYPEGSEK